MITVIPPSWKCLQQPWVNVKSNLYWKRCCMCCCFFPLECIHGWKYEKEPIYLQMKDRTRFSTDRNALQFKHLTGFSGHVGFPVGESLYSGPLSPPSLFSPPLCLTLCGHMRLIMSFAITHTHTRQWVRSASSFDSANWIWNEGAGHSPPYGVVCVCVWHLLFLW